MKLGTRCLPKFLVQKIGKERIIEALNTPEPEFTKDSVVSHQKSRTDYHVKSYTNSDAKMKSKKKWRDIQSGVVPEDPLYSVEDALALAGLS